MLAGVLMMGNLIERVFETPAGEIHCWVSSRRIDGPNIVFLPGLTADHRLFDEQVRYFEGKANCLVWDPPSHGASRPFELTWSMDDLVDWLSAIIEAEAFARPVLVGQSMGGYVAQSYMERNPGVASGFISIDSAPLNRSYFANWELAFLKHTHAMCSSIPWSLLLKWGSNGCSTTEHGRALMREMMEGYQKAEYVDLAAHGYYVLATAVEKSQGSEIACPAVLICGAKDGAGSSKRYNKAWAQKTKLPLIWIEGAGHNSNTDAPDQVNLIIDDLLRKVESHECGLQRAPRCCLLMEGGRPSFF